MWVVRALADCSSDWLRPIQLNVNLQSSQSHKSHPHQWSVAKSTAHTQTICFHSIPIPMIGTHCSRIFTFLSTRLEPWGKPTLPLNRKNVTAVILDGEPNSHMHPPTSAGSALNFYRGVVGPTEIRTGWWRQGRSSSSVHSRVSLQSLAFPCITVCLFFFPLEWFVLLVWWQNKSLRLCAIQTGAIKITTLTHIEWSDFGQCK